MKQSVKRIWNAATTVLISLMVLLALSLWGVRLFGIDVFVVQSGSMEPDYPTGSVVYVRAVNPEKLEVGDVITFRLNADVRGTHRIIEVVQQENGVAFRTKGDANDHPDSGLVRPQDIVGKVFFSVPLLGYMVAYIQHPPGMYIGLSVGALVLLLTFLPELIFDDSKKKEEEVKE